MKFARVFAGSPAPPARRAHLEAWLIVDLPKRFAGRVLVVDADIADKWGVISHELKRNGTPISTVDAMLAATALCRNLVVVTRNVRDFEKTGVAIFKPWEVK